MKKYTIILTLLFASTAVWAQDLTTFYKEADQFLKKYTAKGSVSYAKVNKSLSEVSKLYKDIGNMDLSKASDNEKKAFYINAYNIIVIYQVAKYYPLKSAMDQSGFFDQVKHKVAGEMITLNALEIVKLLRTYKDAKFHFALACAAKGCPKLASFAYFPATLDKQLDERTRMSVNDNYFIRVKNQSNTVEVSMIFKWYMKDFTADSGSILAFVNKYRKNKIPSNFKVAHYEYDWALNTM